MTWHLARELMRRGHEVAVFAAPGSDPALGAVELEVDTLPEHAGRHDVGAPPYVEVAEHHAYLSLMLRARRARRRRSFDVVHNNSLHYLPVAMAPSLPMPRAHHAAHPSPVVAGVGGAARPRRQLVRRGVAPHRGLVGADHAEHLRAQRRRRRPVAGRPRGHQCRVVGPPRGREGPARRPRSPPGGPASRSCWQDRSSTSTTSTRRSSRCSAPTRPTPVTSRRPTSPPSSAARRSPW